MNSDRPWMTALEMQFSALRACVTAPPAMKSSGFNHSRSIRLLSSAEAYSWSKDCVTAVAMASKTIPRDTRLSLEMLPTRNGWWWFETPLGEVRGIAWGLAQEPTDNFLFLEVSTYCFASPDIHIPIELSTFCWRIGTDLTTLLIQAMPARQLSDGEFQQAQEIMSAIGRFVLAGCTWLNQRILTFSLGHIERHRRKQLARENDGPLQANVKVIELRRTESSQRLPSDLGDPVEWSCRWIVNGHWRNQVYANSERKLIYIMPFVKGPADKPLRVPSHTVYQVSR